MEIPSYRYLAIHDRRKKNEMGQYYAFLILLMSLTCFAPGNFLLGARALERDDIFQFGLDILEGCWHTYNVTPTGIGPEGTLPQSNIDLVWQWMSNDASDQPGTQMAREEWEKYGFWSIKRDYFLRPGVQPQPTNLKRLTR